jgi:hypothetical protein
MSRFPSLKAAIVMGTKFAGIMRGLEEEARDRKPSRNLRPSATTIALAAGSPKHDSCAPILGAGR